MTDINALIASAIPVQPPDEWFDNPGLTQPTAIKVLPNGRVFGHVASWDMDHIGMPFGTRPPKSKSGYAYFRTGEIMTASGALVPVGQLTLAGGHASLQATAAEAVKHYDDTASAVADVSVGEDAHGIWVSGAVRSDATPEKIRALRASAPSGDWRMINGRLEMVAVCQVNVPGFPIPRALAAGGQRLALVAAGTAPLLAQVMVESEIEERLQRLEAAHAGKEAEQLALVASAARERFDALRADRLKREAELARIRVREPQRYRAIVAAGTARAAENARQALVAAASRLSTGDYLMESYTDVTRAVKAFAQLEPRHRIRARRTIIASAAEIGAFSALPEAWHSQALVAAGNFDHLDQDFLSNKAAVQPRDDNGRFVQTGAFLRWKVPGSEGFEFGQVIGRKVNPDGTMDVRLADSNTIVKRKPSDVEVIKAILPADQVDRKDDRGIPYKRKEGRKPSTPLGGPGASTPATDPSVIEAPDLLDPATTPVEPGVTPSTLPVGTRVRLIGSPEDLGTVSDDTDPMAIEVTDDGGIVYVHEITELEIVPESPAGAVPTAPAATPAAPAAP